MRLMAMNKQMKSCCCISLMLLLIIITGAQSAKLGSAGGAVAVAVAVAESVVEEVVEEAGEYRPAVMEEQEQMMMNQIQITRRKLLAPFQVCLVCKCCVNATTCVNMPCCFGIDCQLPNKPFGFCAFVPKTCNCATCTS